MRKLLFTVAIVLMYSTALAQGTALPEPDAVATDEPGVDAVGAPEATMTTPAVGGVAPPEPDVVIEEAETDVDVGSRQVGGAVPPEPDTVVGENPDMDVDIPDVDVPDVDMNVPEPGTAVDPSAFKKKGHSLIEEDKEDLGTGPMDDDSVKTAADEDADPTLYKKENTVTYDIDEEAGAEDQVPETTGEADPRVFKSEGHVGIEDATENK